MVIRDITDCTRAEEQVRALNRLLRTISEVDKLIVRATDRKALLSHACRILVERCGFLMAWIGFADPASSLVAPAARAGVRPDYVDGIVVRFDESPEGRGPVGTAIRTGEHVVIDHVEMDPSLAPWRERMLACGFRTVGAFPIRSHGAVTGALAVYASEAIEISNEETALLDEMAEDLSYALETIDNREELKQGEKALRESEERYRTLVAQSPDGIFLADLQGNFLSVNEGMCEQLGFSEAELLAGGIWAIVPERFREAQRDRLARILRGERINEPAEYEVRTKKGDTRIVEIRSSPFRKDGKVVGFHGIARDVTERRRTEISLRESDERLRSTLEAVHAVAWELDLLTGELTETGPVAALFGRPKGFAHPSETSFLESIHPDDRSPVRERLAAAARDESDYTVSYRTLRPDGSMRWIQATGDRVRDAEGRPVRILGIAQDITERKRLEEHLEQKEALYRSVIENATDLILLVGGDGVVNFASPSLTGCLGYEVPDVVGTNLFVYFHPDEVEESKRDFGIGVRNGFPVYPKERRIRHKDGSWRDFEYAAVNLLQNPDVRGIVAVCRNVTERRNAEAALVASEQRYRLLAEQSLAGIVRATLKGEILDCNPAMVRMFGYESAEELKKQSATALYADPEDRQRFLSRLLSEKSVSDFEFTGIRKDGRRIVVLENSRLVETGGLSPVIGTTLFDVTEHRQLEEQLRQSQKMEAFGQLAGGVAHDFNNLLTVIGGYAEIMIRRPKVSDPSLADLNEILKAADRATALTRQLLTFSRKQVISPVVIRLSDVVVNTEKMLKRLIGEDIILVSSHSPDPWAVKADPGQIEQVVLNLAVNARDAMPKGGQLFLETGNVQIAQPLSHFHGTLPPGQYASLTVRDTGCGMSAETMHRIFEPFFTTKGPGKGTGLGMATVYGIVKQNDGEIIIESEPGRGATFTVYLPRVADRMVSSVRRSPVAGLPRGSETILLAEDEESVRRFMKLVLTTFGYTVLEARNGVEALNLLSTHKEEIHLVISDIVMPEMGGREMAKRAARSRPHTPFLLISGYPDPPSATPAEPDGTLSFLQKPFTPATLLHKVREVLSGPKVGA